MIRKSGGRSKGKSKSRNKIQTRISSAISSEDKNAIPKLEKKLAQHEDLQTKMKAINKVMKAKKPSKEEKVKFLMKKYDMSEHRTRQLFEEDFAGRIGFPSYSITNNGAEIRRIKKRIASLKDKATHVSSEKRVGNIRIVDNVEENRLQIYFNEKPDADTRKKLKSGGFRWSPSRGVWQAYRSPLADHRAEKIVKDYTSNRPLRCATCKTKVNTLQELSECNTTHQ